LCEKELKWGEEMFGQIQDRKHLRRLLLIVFLLFALGFIWFSGWRDRQDLRDADLVSTFRTTLNWEIKGLAWLN